MAKRKAYPPPLVGDIWEDCDPRMRARRLEVVAIDETHATMARSAHAVTRIRLDRMRPTSTGFRLVVRNGQSWMEVSQ